MNHTVLEDALPLVFDALHLVICAKDDVLVDVSHAASGTIVFVRLGVVVIEVGVDSLRVLILLTRLGT